MGCKIVGLGSYLPKQVVKNDFFTVTEKYAPDMQEYFDGIITRHHASKEESSVYMGAEACKVALADAKMDPSEIDLLLTYSIPNDNEVPKDGSFIAAELGLKNATAIYVDTVCSSFLTLLKTASAFIESGYHKNVMISVTSNWVNRCMDKTKDYSSLGDGAGAVILTPSDQKSLIGFKEECRPEFASVICMASPLTTDNKEYFKFGKTAESKEFFTIYAVNVAKTLMAECSMFPSQVDWFISHQPGKRLIENWSNAIELPLQKNLNTLEQYGNTSAANTLITLDHFVKNGTVKRGDNILFFSPAAGVHNMALLWKY